MAILIAAAITLASPTAAPAQTFTPYKR